ncbi:hypothetical protein [Bacillus smithii]|uniref:hypothetical protein n=1 Tax=Bacillus smithii TaxID=1479 RepID=UPI002E1BB283|nr:hypothetical protein [Bacillus smithii]MED4929037.1 hypothetical protein [Bacillus smithii]
MLRKEAKRILKQIQQDAKRRNTYYVILKKFWPYGGLTDPRKIAYDMGANEDIWTDIFKLEQRYRRFCHYIKEVKPQWKNISLADYADNSIELIQENEKGERRTVILQGPSGDICF